MRTSSVESRRKDEIAKYVRAYTHEDYKMGAMRVKEWWDYLETLNGSEVRGLLDVGCGRAESLEAAVSLGFVAHGCEVVSALLKENVFPIPGIHDLEIIGSGAYDLVACQDVLEHILEDDVHCGLRELVRVAKHRVYISVAWFPSDYTGGEEREELHICLHDAQWWMDQLNTAAPDGTVRMLKSYRRDTARFEVTLTL